MNKRTLMVFIVVITIFVVSCTSSKDYEQPTTDQPSQDAGTTSGVQTFNVGDTATDGKLRMTIHSINFMDKITYSPGDIETTTEEVTSDVDFYPKEGYQFLIIDLTIENLQPDRTSIISSLMQFKVIDEAGYSYDYSLRTIFLDRKFEDGNLLPGMKRRGNVAFELPINSKGLEFHFLFEMGGTTAVFELQ